MKTYPRTSGGTRVNTFNNEFRARLSLTVSPLPSLICFSKARIESMLTSRPILVPKQYQASRSTSKRVDLH
jgi:hypothetical protein